jgi:proteasome lid subunit RPN8/RPN11
MRIEYKLIGRPHDLLADLPHERCGVIMGRYIDGGICVRRLAEVKNWHPEPELHFRMTKVDVARTVRRSLYSPLGYWHTHPAGTDPEPSPDDQEQMKCYPHYVGLVIHPESGRATWFNNNNILKIEVVPDDW